MKWDERNERLAIFLLGVEFGVRQHEKGKNLQLCLSVARNVWDGNQPEIRHGKKTYNKLDVSVTHYDERTKKYIPETQREK